MPRSAPLASASLMVCFTRSGPMDRTTTSPPCFSLRRRASSRAKLSGSFISKPISVSRIQEPSGMMCSGASLAGTCLTQTAIFTFRNLDLIALEDESGVGATETERIGKRVRELSLASVIWNVIEIALRVGMFVIDRRRKNLIAQGEHADAGLEASGTAEQVSGHRFRGADSQMAGVIAEDAFDGDGFDRVAQ